jgi:hypothetical protein
MSPDRLLLGMAFDDVTLGGRVDEDGRAPRSRNATSTSAPLRGRSAIHSAKLPVYFVDWTPDKMPLFVYRHCANPTVVVT